MDANIPVCFAVKTSAEWAASGLALLKGQPAFEAGEDGRLLYILVGDGNPVNVNPPGVSANPAYTRLRDTYATDLVKNAAQGSLDAHKTETAEAHGIPAQIDAKVTAHADETTAAHNIPGQIDAKVTAHDDSGDAHPGIRLGLLDLDGAKASKEDFLNMYGLTVETSGGLLREYDRDGRPSLPFQYLRTVDAEPGTAPGYREADSSRFNHADYATKRDWERIANIVMSASGEMMRVADREGAGFEERAVDRERGVPEIRNVDYAGTGGVFDDAAWV